MPSPRVYRANAIVLRRINLGETDKILTLLTREKGKLSAVAKGARRPASRLSGATELFNYFRALLAVGQNLDVLTQAEVRQSFPKVRHNLEKIAAAGYMTEMADHFTEERLPQEDVFDLLLSALYVLNSQDGVGLLVTAFTLQLMAAAGYTPDFDACVRCRRPDAPLIGFSSAMGGAICRDCRPSVKDSLFAAPESLEAARKLMAMQLPNAARQQVPERVRGQVLKIVRAFLLYRCERPLKSARFLDEILAAGRLRRDDTPPARLADGLD